LLGIVIASVSTGLREELATRGLLQPRLGVFLTNLLFATIHSRDYHWDGLLLVFIGGFVMAWARNRYNTVCAVIVHVTYNTTVIGLL